MGLKFEIPIFILRNPKKTAYLQVVTLFLIG